MRSAAKDLLKELPGAERATWIWSDGSATGGVCPAAWARILFSNHSRWRFFNQFGEFSSLAKFVGGSQEDASPFGSAARYIRAYVPHSCIIVEALAELEYKIRTHQVLIYFCRLERANKQNGVYLRLSN